MKENEAFGIPFINKKQLKREQALHRIYLKPQYKVYRGSSILYFNAPFSDVPSFLISTPRFEAPSSKQSCLPPLTFKISLKANINIY